MTWKFTGDIEEYAAHVWPLLAQEPATHTIALTTIDSARTGRFRPADDSLFGWYAGADGAVTGAFGQIAG